MRRQHARLETEYLQSVFSLTVRRAFIPAKANEKWWYEREGVGAGPFLVPIHSHHNLSTLNHRPVLREKQTANIVYQRGSIPTILGSDITPVPHKNLNQSPRIFIHSLHQDLITMVAALTARSN